MERFNYKSIKKARKESAEILQLLEYESWGYKQDEKERLARQQAELAQQQRG
jgi:hypothetical protein